MDIEIKRQIIHATGIVNILFIQIFGKAMASLIILGITLVFLSAAYYRLNKTKLPSKIKVVEDLENYVNMFERPKEFPLKGAITFYAGSFLAVVIFSPVVAISSITVLALADSLSTLIGKFYGKHKLPINKKKSWEGSTTFFITALVVLAFFTNFYYAVLVSLITTVAEALPKIDDNITIPITVGIFMSFA